jgi:nucleoside-diphosphate-sugar epimerase
VFVDDAVDAIMAAMDSTAALGKTYTLGGECMSIAELVAACIRAFDSASRIIKVPESAVRLAAGLSRVLPLPLYPDQLSRLRASKSPPSHDALIDLRFRPRALAEGLAYMRTASAKAEPGQS